MGDYKSKRGRVDPGMTSSETRPVFIGVLVNVGQNLVKGQNDLVGISLGQAGECRPLLTEAAQVRDALRGNFAFII
jgi:hypothetical protein